MPMVPKKAIPSAESVPLCEMWADLVETDPTLAQALGQVPLFERLVSMPKRAIDWIGKGFYLEAPIYPWL
jgi:hypothetical protein